MMKKATHIQLMLFSFVFWSPVYAISFVWNFRIAQITGQPIVEGSENRNHSVVGLLFDQYRRKYTGVYQNFVGLLGSYILHSGDWYMRADTAFSHIKEKNAGLTTFKGTETDDILFTVGRGFELSDQTRMTFSLLVGVPTHKILRFKHIDFGYGQIGLAGQWDGSFAQIYDASRGAVLYGARYIHFFERDADDSAGCLYRFSVGNVADILLAYKHSWKKHGFEVGSTLRWRFGAHISPYLPDAVERANYKRANVYAVYKYKFMVHDIENRLLYYISFGRDRAPKTFGNRWIVTLWTSWNGRF